MTDHHLPALGIIMLDTRLRRAFAIPVFDVVTMGSWFYGGLVERHFGQTISEGAA
jgi:hypothetical protein